MGGVSDKLCAFPADESEQAQNSRCPGIAGLSGPTMTVCVYIGVGSLIHQWTHLSSSVEPMSICPCRWWMAFFAPCGLSRCAMAVPGLFTSIFTYSSKIYIVQLTPQSCLGYQDDMHGKGKVCSIYTPVEVTLYNLKLLLTGSVR